MAEATSYSIAANAQRAGQFRNSRGWAAELETGRLRCRKDLPLERPPIFCGNSVEGRAIVGSEPPLA
jgi:hypothetical protein